jgi:hypothetical protein
MGPDIEQITTLDLQLGINIWMEHQIHRYFHQWTLEDGIIIPERTFVNDLIQHIRQHDEIYGIARAYEEDTNADPWTISTLRTLINRVTEEGRLPRNNQENHPEVQRMNTQESTALQDRIRRSHSKHNPDHGDGEGMWMTDKPLQILDSNTQEYFTTNGGWKTHCPYECGRSTQPCPMSHQVVSEAVHEYSTGK